jgi:uncharacterized protein
MKIRTITMGFPYHADMDSDDFIQIAQILKEIKKRYQQNHYDVQTIRMSTQPFTQYAKTKHEVLSEVKRLAQWMNDQGIDYFNIGPTNQQEQITWIPEILSSSPTVFCTVHICNQHTIFYDHIKKVSEIIRKNAMIEPQGFTNLRFATLCNIKPYTPFYPASYHHQSPPSFGIGLENSDLVYQAFKNAESFENAQDQLRKTLLENYLPIETIAEELSSKYDIIYDGIDTSISTSVHEQESIAYAYENLMKGYRFGNPATLTISKIITDTIHDLPIKKTGYCGLMLPVLEDHGLSVRNKERMFSITDLLLYSSVCGTGLDTIPLPGDCTKQEIQHILLDVATLSIKLQKPLSARLMPIPGKQVGDMTEFSFPYFKNSTVMNPR